MGNLDGKFDWARQTRDIRKNLLAVTRKLWRSAVVKKRKVVVVLLASDLLWAHWLFFHTVTSAKAP